MSTGQNVQVHVKNGLACMPIAVDDGAIALLMESTFPSYLLGRQKQTAHQRGMLWLQII